MTNEEYIRTHRHEDVRTLALKKVPEGVDARWCLQQIEGWQLARKKLPRWADTEGIWFPPRLSMEQCSSELTARYKTMVLQRLMREQGIIPQDAVFADLNGGFGIDFSYLSESFGKAIYVEKQTQLCDIARHNLPMLANNVTVVEADCTQLNLSELDADVLYLDPARRDEAGRKVVALEDCTPDLTELQDRLLGNARLVMVKLSPMLDITQALRQLRSVCEVHVVSVRGECKEMLLVMGREEAVSYHCVNLDAADDDFVCHREEAMPTLSDIDLWHAFSTSDRHSTEPDGTEAGKVMLFEPNASVLKAGVQDALCSRYGIRKLHPQSNLFVGTDAISGFPGRQFSIDSIGDFSKAGLRQALAGLKQANLTIRNFPSTVAELRKRLKLKEGGDTYLFATTLTDGKHVLIRGRKT